MIKPIDKGFTEKFTKDNSHLKYCRSTGGGGVGCLTLGGFLAACFALLGILIKDFMPPQKLLILMAGGIGFGVLLIVLGIFLYKKRVGSYLSYYADKNKYSKQDIENLDREILAPGSVVIVNQPKVNKQSLIASVILTEHWIKLSSNNSMVSRLVDMAGIWFDPRPTDMGRTLDPQVCLLDSRGKLRFLPSDERYGSEVISEALKRNPKLITSRRFEFEGVQYDCLTQYQEVAEVYRRAARI